MSCMVCCKQEAPLINEPMNGFWPKFVLNNQTAWGNRGETLEKLGQLRVNFITKDKVVVLLTLKNVAVSLEYEF